MTKILSFFEELILKLKEMFNNKSPVVLVDEYDAVMIKLMYSESINDQQRKKLIVEITAASR